MSWKTEGFTILGQTNFPVKYISTDTPPLRGIHVANVQIIHCVSEIQNCSAIDQNVLHATHDQNLETSICKIWIDEDNVFRAKKTPEIGVIDDYYDSSD